MYLLHTSALVLCTFSEPDIPEYAILSHRWENGEVLFADIRDNVAETRPGFAKVKGCCDLALLAGLEYVWIDTCCIDKSSSAELSEAIYSMFRWYQDARVCYVYLSDVPGGISAEQHEQASSFFRKSAWFGRGWTLQELLAPEFVVFYDQDWHEIGTKRSLRTLLSSITSIAPPFLIEITTASAAQKMCWASQRKTSRIEDTAYCLLGIFGVHLTPIYGEGSNAFLRLQLEIINKSNDQSILAWTSTSHKEGYAWEVVRSVLANQPSSFAGCQDIVRNDSSLLKTSYSVTSRGLRLEHQVLLPAEDLGVKFRNNTFVAVLNCSQSASSDFLGIYLRTFGTGDELWRTEFDRLAPCKRAILQTLQPRAPIAYLSIRNAFEDRSQILRHDRVDIHEINLRANGFEQVGQKKHNPQEPIKPAHFIWRLHDSQQREGFFVVADRVGTVVGINIFTFSGCATWRQLREELCTSSFYSPKDRRRFDRLSRSLPSGRVVSVALMIGRRENQRETTSAGWQQFLARTMVSPHGSLPWPESRALSSNSASTDERFHLTGLTNLPDEIGNSPEWPGESRVRYSKVIIFN